MKPANGSSFARRMLNAAAMVTFAGALYACGGGGTSVAGAGDLSQAQFDALLKTSTVYTDLTTKLASDEDTIARMRQFGHAPGAKVIDGRRTLAIDPHTGLATLAVSFGPCPDMGTHIGDSAPDPSSAQTEYFQQCPINGAQYMYGAVVETGAIAPAVAIWFDGTNCTGNMFEAQNAGGYNRQVLQSGVVFTSPVDGATIYMVEAGQAEHTVSLQSNSSGGICSNNAQSITAYPVLPNDVSVTGVPGSVPSDFIF